MSSDEHSDSSSEDEEDINTTGLIATRAKRSTAGNLYETLRANLDDEELQKELLAEDEDDQGEYEGSEKDDDDEALESSSDEEDAGPPKAGEAEDLEGEKELKKQERAENKRKRKMEEAKMRLPAWQKKKKVKLADDVKTEDGAATKPKKKSERSNWLPTEADMPVRQSARSSAIANREVVHTNLKESALRSEKQKRVMAKHAERQNAKKRADLTQEQRLEKTAKIEKETAREFGRWEREEAERQRIRDEQLAAKRKRGIEGPVIRHWSGSVLWVGEKIKNNRLHGSINVDELKDEPKDEPKEDLKEHPQEPGASDSKPPSSAAIDPEASKSTSTADVSLPASGTGTPLQQFLNAPAQELPAAPPPPLPSSQPVSWLEGIQEYAAQQPGQPSPMPLRQSPYTPSAPAIHGTPLQPPQQASTAPQPSEPSAAPPQIYHGWPPSYHGPATYQTQPTVPPTAPPAPLPPPPKIQAQRSLVMLEQFENLDNVTSKRSSRASKDSALEPNALALTLLPLSYPSFSPEQTRYLTKTKKVAGVPTIPPAPDKTKCALTSWPAKFRDPKTGLAYADLQTYKMIQRMLAGGCQWSSLLGAWCGPQYGALGRAASGVPDGFASPAPAPAVDEVKTEDVT